MIKERDQALREGEDVGENPLNERQRPSLLAMLMFSDTELYI